MQKYESILSRYGYTTETAKKITTGHVNIIYHMEDQKLILKIACTEKERLEIKKNMEAYGKLSVMKLDSLIPRIYEYDEDFLLMEYLGQDFAYTGKNESDYIRLCEELHKIFTQTVQKTGNGLDLYVQSLVALIKDNMTNYKLDEPLPDLMKEFSRFAKDFEDVQGNVCFASWDLTPHNVFLNPEFKIIDIKGDVIGCPIPNLSAFAGVASTVLALPNSDKGYCIIKNYCSLELPILLGISSELGEKLFVLGRFLQQIMGARFRIDTEPDKALVYLHGARKMLA
jgi:hypothetical protein